MKTNLSYPRNLTRYSGKKLATERLLWFRQNPTRHQGKGNIGYSAFPSELNYVIYIGKVENLNFFTEEWFYRPDSYRGTLPGGIFRMSFLGEFYRFCS